MLSNNHITSRSGLQKKSHRPNKLTSCFLYSTVKFPRKFAPCNPLRALWCPSPSDCIIFPLKPPSPVHSVRSLWQPANDDKRRRCRRRWRRVATMTIPNSRREKSLLWICDHKTVIGLNRRDSENMAANRISGDRNFTFYWVRAGGLREDGGRRMIFFIILAKYIAMLLPWLADIDGINSLK